MKSKNAFWADGLKFQCQGSGNCCVSRGDYGYVYLTRSDRVRLARKVKMDVQSFTDTFCDQADGIWRLKDSSKCLFLDKGCCSVYEARPTQCRTWPFWPENMNAKTWNKEVARFCAGVGKGRVWTAKEISDQLKLQSKSEADYGS